MRRRKRRAAEPDPYVGQTGCHNAEAPKSPLPPRWVADRRQTVVRVMGTWLAIAGVLLLLTAPLAEAQDSRPGNVTRVGALMVTSRQSAPDLWDAFRQGLRERGWVEGQILVIEERSAEGHVERSAKLAAELVRLKVDVIVAPNPWSARAAKSATTTIPIVMIVVDDPVGAGLVASLARPGATSLDSRRLWARRKSSANSWSCSRKPSQMSPASPC